MPTRQSIINAAIANAVSSTYDKLPPLPRWHDLARSLRKLNEALTDGGCTVTLYCQDARWPEARWVADSQNLCPGERWPGADHTEELPGDGKWFDSAAAARRLLSEARSAGFK